VPCCCAVVGMRADIRIGAARHVPRRRVATRPEPAEIDWHTRFWENLSQQECLDAGFDDSKWMTAHVPGYVQFDCGLKSRYWGYELFRVNFSPWVYRKTFSVPTEFSGRRVELRFGGVQYWTRFG